MRRSRTPARPAEVRAALTAISEAALAIAGEYDWAFGFGYSPSAGDGAKVRTGPTDPTGSVVSNEHRERTRERVTRAADLVAEALSNLRAARSLLDRSFADRRPAPEPEPDRYPRTATRADLEGAREAQRRRAARGEGWGES